MEIEGERETKEEAGNSFLAKVVPQQRGLRVLLFFLGLDLLGDWFVKSFFGVWLLVW